MTTVHQRLVAVGLGAAGFTLAAISIANTAINAEGVSDYSYYRAHNGGASDIQGAQEATGFINGMTQSGSGWSYGQLYVDNNVGDTDFMDPDVSGGNAVDDDTTYFDNSGAAIGFVSGHGSCNDATGTSCNTSSDCGTGTCPGTPPSTGSSRCISNSARRLVLSSSFSQHNNFMYYGDGHTKWGESTSAGSWGGAGTNGGLMAAFLANSCGVRAPFYSSQIQPMFAGVAQINMIMPISNTTNGFSDLIEWSSRGSVLATYALANPSSSIKNAWDANLDSSASNHGRDCPDLQRVYTYGGGHSIQGCGGNFTAAFDINLTDATWDVNTMTWLNARTAS